MSSPSRDQLIIDAAIRRGMDGEAVAELLRTKQPVIKVKVEPNGETKTTTYKLGADGSISSNTVTERKTVRHFESGSLPDSVRIDDVLNSPTGTVTRSFIDKDGAKVTQTYSISSPKTTSIFDSVDNSNWFNDNGNTWINSDFPSNVHRSNVPQNMGPTNYHKTVSTYTGPDGKKSVVESWSSGSGSQEPEHTYSSSNWPSFNSPPFSTPWQPRNTGGNANEWSVVEGNPDVETTTRHKFPSWTPKTWDFPDIPSIETTTFRRPFETKPTTPLPSLEDFLKTQYNQSTYSKNTPTTTPGTKTTTATTQQKTHTIKVEDLPVTQVLHNGQPADEDILKMLPPHLKPKSPSETVNKIENILPNQTETTPQNVETNYRTITKTHIGNAKPTLADLDPEMREILRRAGISPEDITKIDGDTITKTRMEPDGRTITTTYKVRTSPTTVTSYEQSPPKVYTTSHSYKPFESSGTSSFTPFNTAFKPNPISEYLAKVGLTESDIYAKNGEYTRTFIDDDGQVLTATFVLSRPMNGQTGAQHKKKPLK